MNNVDYAFYLFPFVVFANIVPVNFLSLPIKPIVRGENRTEVYKPYAALFKRGEQNCGASWLTSQVLLTASHCIKNMTSLEYYSVNFIIGWGTHYKPDFHDYHNPFLENNPNVRFARVCRTEAFEPEFDNTQTEKKFFHELAFLILCDPQPIDGSFQLVRVNTEQPEEWSEVTIYGFGLDEDNSSPDLLKQAEMYVSPDKLCQYFLNGMQNWTDQSFRDHRYRHIFSCLVSQTGGAGKGDSGGPVILKNSRDSEVADLIGITVAGIADGQSELVTDNWGNSRYVTIYASIHHTPYFRAINKFLTYVP